MIIQFTDNHGLVAGAVKSFHASEVLARLIFADFPQIAGPQNCEPVCCSP